MTSFANSAISGTRVCCGVVEQLNSAASVPRGFVVAASSTNDTVAPPSVITHNNNSVTVQLVEETARRRQLRLLKNK